MNKREALAEIERVRGDADQQLTDHCAETTRLRARIAELEAQRDGLQMQVESETYSKCFTDTNVGDD